MMKKFSQESISTQNQLKSSVQRSVRASILSQYPLLEEVIDEILPKKGNIVLAKCSGHIQFIVFESIPLFFQQRDGPWFPTLRLLHKYPDMMPTMQVDKGAIKYVLKGSNIMCPGLTSPGGKMDNVGQKQVVKIVGEGCTNACSIGITIMSTAEIEEINKGICIENIHYLNDGLWQVNKF
ncbi:MCT like PUA RNA binding domain containing [Cryptosporidium bovis]|uniref:MCT like PUA RNA binding domain containing n=1 Tax=Cryptosporidium bovis TaxID=310047 RepID=UPI00351A32A3|nr:MCT like PUA RNA binding domain containing [Cryptosporidium bovis]